MKVATKSIESFLTAPQRECQAVLIYGVDSGLVRERAAKITKAVLGDMASDPFAKLELSEAELLTDPARLADELSAVSMMCPKRVIIIYDAGNSITGVIESAASYFHKDNFLIVVADELSGKSSLRAFFEKENSCAALACYKDEMRDIQSVIRSKLDGAKIIYNRDVVDYLASQLGNDRYVTYQELDKLITYAGDEKKITVQDAQLLTDNNRDSQLDDIITAIADRNLVNLEKNLYQHLREGTQPIMYLRALSRYFARLYSIRAQMQETRQSAEVVVAGLRPPVFWKQKDPLIRHANSWGLENIIKAIGLITAAELDCKTSDLPIIPASSRKLFRITQLR
ncbi:MAG: DNA polymerase III subunit delta [Rickettsiales bacterium]